MLVSTVQKCESAICIHIFSPSWTPHPHPSPHPLPLGHHRAPSWAPCIIQQFLTSCLFYTWWRICVKPNLPIYPPFPMSHVYSLHLRLSSCPGTSNHSWWISFLGSLHLMYFVHSKLLQSCLTLWDTMDYSSLGSSVCGDSPGKNTGVGSSILGIPSRGSSWPRD